MNTPNCNSDVAAHHCELPGVLADIAVKDAERIAKFCYQGTPVSTKRGYKILCQGKGPKICMRQGFGVFKASYAISEHDLKAQIVPQLQQTKGILDLAFIYRIDAENPFGDWGQHHWRIVEAVQ